MSQHRPHATMPVPPRPLLPAADLDSRLEEARALKELEDQVVEQLHNAARAARTAGASWRQIGRALGMPSKTAWNRYSGHANSLRPAS